MKEYNERTDIFQMNIPSVDRRSAGDIAEYIKNLSLSYTPEWNFDDKNPDAGTALALIYSQMHYETVRRLNGTAQKIMFDFFNSINTEMLPASAAEGYVSFGLSNEKLDYNAEIKSGTQLAASENGSQIIFRTTEDVLVNNADIKYMMLADGNDDIIINLFDSETDTWKNITVFNTDSGDNIQKHMLKIYHHNVFNTDEASYISIRFVKTDSDNDDISVMIADAVSSGKIKMQYYSENGYTDFLQLYAAEDSLKAYKSDTQPPFMMNDENFEIRIISESKNLFADKTFKRIECCSESRNIIPEAVFTNETEKNTNEFCPFNEKPFRYDEFYIASKDAFCKKGAYINISFYMDFIRTDINEEQNNPPQIEYKLIMKHSQFAPEEKFDITINEVIWEYFNGRGWAKLFRNNQYSDIFQPQDGRKTKTVSFICPDDIVSITVNSRESYYIRARILSLDNQFRTKGYYVAPVLSEITIDYCYREYVVPDKIVCCNNTVEETAVKNDIIKPFRYIKDKYPELYFGFSQPPQYGPVRYLFCMQDNVSFETLKLKWSFLSDDGWKFLNIFDETENFRKTGTISLIGNSGFKYAEIFGKSAYWIKASDFSSGYSDSKNRFFPVIEKIYKNIAPVINVNDMPEEFFSIEPYEENKVCRLSADRIYEAEVWVDEISQLTAEETENLCSAGLADITYDIFGMPSNVWVKWHETMNMNFSAPDDRHFRVDRNNGTVTFGNNIKGKIPPYKNGRTIKIRYSTGGGKSGNVEKGRISKINQSLGFVTDVSNPVITYGGSDCETAENAIKRTSAALRSCNRAVTASDYESLALEAERSILKVRCISNMLPDGTKSFGNILLVMLIENYEKEKSCFLPASEKVRKYIASRMSSSLYSCGNLHIIQPQFVYYNIKAEISVRSFKNIFEIKSGIEKKIHDFLDINSGNFNNKGWNIGVLPNSVQILNAIKNTEGVAFVKNVSLTAYVNINSEIYDVDINNLKGREFSLAVSGKHDIIMNVE